MSDEENIEDIDEQMIDEVMNVISTDGYYQQAEIVKVTCPVCGEEFLGTKRHAGGFIAGHRSVPVCRMETNVYDTFEVLLELETCEENMFRKMDPIRYLRPN